MDLGNRGAQARVRARQVVIGPQGSRWALVRMTAAERQRYVNWWVKHSGLTPRQLRQIATAIWTDRLLDEVTHGVRPLEVEAQFDDPATRECLGTGERQQYLRRWPAIGIDAGSPPEKFPNRGYCRWWRWRAATLTAAIDAHPETIPPPE